MALRYDYGNDYMNYYNNHALMNAGEYAWGASDLLFHTLNVTIKNFFALIAIISIFYLFSIRDLIKNNLDISQYWFAILLLLINPYLFLMHLSTLRQTLAICFFIFAVNSAVKRKFIPYMIIILLATGMHFSAILLLPLYFILTDKPVSKIFKIITVIGLLILVFTPLFNLVLGKIMEYMPAHYSAYIDMGLQNSLRATILSSFYFFLILFNMDKLEGKEIIYGKLSLISTVVSILAYKLSMITRVGMYFDIFLIVTIPHIFKKMNNKLSKIILFSIMLAIYVLRYYSFFTNPLWESFVTYKTILNVK